MSLDKIQILGVQVNSVNLEDSIKLIEKFILEKGKHQVCVPNVYTTVLMQKDDELKKINNSCSLAVPDGMPLVWVSKLYGKPIPERVTGSDLFQRFAKVAAQKGYKFFFLGAAPDTVKKMTVNLEEKYPLLNIVGTYSPPFLKDFPEEENHKMIGIINKTKPDVLWVGLTAPKQEKWIGRNLDKLNVPVSIGVGAVFDFMAGKARRAPNWLQKIGLEWLYRLCQEPGRLWKRYLVGNSIFIWGVMKEFVKMQIKSANREKR
jgi:N-acetylglucosaminyldiphosphoundecaprenol N-acetyl-beta-D-mannosaminyltransferase